MSAKGPMAPQSWMFVGTNECCWGHGAMLMSAHGCLWVLMRASECLRGPKSIISAHKGPWCHTLGAPKHSWVFMITHDHSYGAMSTQEHGTIALTALIGGNENLWAWCHGAITTQSALAQYISVLTSAHECSWVLLSNPEYSWVILSVQVLDSIMNKKCWFLKLLPFSILAIYLSKYHQIIKN